MAGGLPIDSDLTLKRWKPDDPERKPGRHAVRCEGARGLFVRMFDTGAITWGFRFKLHGRTRVMSLGPYPAISLSVARDLAREAYAHVKAGRDPIEVQRRADAETEADLARQKTFAEYAKEYIADRRETFKTPKLGKLWGVTINRYAVPHLGKLALNDITEQHIQAMLLPIFNEKRETANRVRQRTAAIIGAAMEEGLRDREKLNPARSDAISEWRKRRNVARKGSAGRRGSHPAVPVPLAPAWFAALRERDGMGARALEFLALTSTRSGEVRLAVWENVHLDVDPPIWIVPAEDSKMSLDPNREAHRVPLSKEAVALLKGLERREGVERIFPSPRDGILSDMSLSKVMRSMHAESLEAGGSGWVDSKTGRPAVPHGLRSTFRTWAAPADRVRFEVAEAVLAHAVGGPTSLAYQRGHFFEDRVPVMQAWAAYLTGSEAKDAVDPLTAAIEVLRATGLSAEEILARMNGENVVPIAKGAA